MDVAWEWSLDGSEFDLFFTRLRTRYQPECASTRFLYGMRTEPDASAYRLIKRGLILTRAEYILHTVTNVALFGELGA